MYRGSHNLKLKLGEISERSRSEFIELITGTKQKVDNSEEKEQYARFLWLVSYTDTPGCVF